MVENSALQESDFTAVWAAHVLKDWWKLNDYDPDLVEITGVQVKLNGCQGLLSTTFIVDVDFKYEKTEENKSLFVKVPLRSNGKASFHEANLRESCMFKKVLPELQTFLADDCTDVLQLPIPEIVYSSYSNTDVKDDVFILENLLASDFTAFTETCYTKEYLKSCIECMAQLHGTGIAYKNKILRTEDSDKKGISPLKTVFPDLNEQANIQELLQEKENKRKFSRNFVPFLKYIENQDKSLSNYANFLLKTEKNIIKILKKASASGIENLESLCHGDAKPDNMMFRRIDIELDELSCQGLEGILIDWQQTFIGSVSNDLMWLLPPFLEKIDPKECSLAFALDYYFSQVKHVLESFGESIDKINLKDESESFQNIIKSGFLLEFFSVVILNPILSLKNSKSLRKWYRKMARYQERIKERSESDETPLPTPPQPPTPESLGLNEQFGKFANLYCKVSHILGVFPQIGSINVELVREQMFREEGEKETQEDEIDLYSDEEEDLTDDEESADDNNQNKSSFSKIIDWVLQLFGICQKQK